MRDYFRSRFTIQLPPMEYNFSPRFKTSANMASPQYFIQLFASRKNKNMFTAVTISDNTTPIMRKTLSHFYFGFERQYWSIFRSFNLNEWTVNP